MVFTSDIFLVVLCSKSEGNKIFLQVIKFRWQKQKHKSIFVTFIPREFRRRRRGGITDCLLENFCNMRTRWVALCDWIKKSKLMSSVKTWKTFNMSHLLFHNKVTLSFEKITAGKLFSCLLSISNMT